MNLLLVLMKSRPPEDESDNVYRDRNDQKDCCPRMRWIPLFNHTFSTGKIEEHVHESGSLPSSARCTAAGVALSVALVLDICGVVSPLLRIALSGQTLVMLPWMAMEPFLCT